MNKDKIIRKSEDFTKIIKNNQSVKNKYFSIYYQKSDKTLYGITIPKKIGKAHIRNKLKRQLKNIIINNEKDIQTNINYVIIIKELSVNLNYEELQNEFINLIKKVRI
ncbi:MAG: ribonuclease P protein component [Mycoplasmatota bacterium]|nr:ribonuclease P protein component [Mycoplasmatota bacterium]